MNYKKYIDENIIRCEASHRGGGIEINCQPLFKIENAKASAYQNYLGGGLLGSVCFNANFETENDKQAEQLQELAEALKKYFHDLANHDDEWENESYEANQNKPESAY